MRYRIALFALVAAALGAQSNDGALARFLVKAKIEGYASGDQSRLRKLSDGGMEASFTEGEYSYRDRWYGENAFAGEEIVHYRGKPAWSMNFYGVSARDAPPEFPAFHKAALRRVPLAQPFRGPARYQEGEFVYLNDVQGSIRDFSGLERVLFRGREIFRLVYHGGVLE